jgi:hypothetical protein
MTDPRTIWGPMVARMDIRFYPDAVVEIDSLIW